MNTDEIRAPRVLYCERHHMLELSVAAADCRSQRWMDSHRLRHRRQSDRLEAAVIGPTQSLRVVSYGGGVQSTALLVLAAQRRIDFPTFLMANVGDDSEHPATLAYVRDVAMPYAAEHGIELHLLDRTRRDGTVETLWGRLMDDRSRLQADVAALDPADFPCEGLIASPPCQSWSMAGTSYYLTERRLGAHLAAHRNAGHDIPEGIEP